MTCTQCKTNLLPGDLVYNRMLAACCPVCGVVMYEPQKEAEPKLLKLAEYNQQVLNAIDIVEQPKEDTEDQYFIMYGTEEGEYYNPEKVVGVWGATELATIMAYYRETGVLRLPKLWRAPRFGAHDYDFIQPKWVIFTKAETMFTRIEGMQEVERMQE